MGNSLRHVGIVVSNLEKAIDIYQNFLGCEMVSKYDGLSGNYQDILVGIKKVSMDAAILKTSDNNRIELLEYLSHPGKKRNPVLSNDIGASHFPLQFKILTVFIRQKKNLMSNLFRRQQWLCKSSANFNG